MKAGRLSVSRVGAIETILPNQIPDAVAGYFSDQSILYTDETVCLKPDDFDALMVARHSNGASSYVAQQDKTYASNGQTERIYHVADALQSGDMIGYGEIRYALTDTSPFFKDKPFVGWLFTDPAYRRTRASNLFERLVTMRNISEQKLGLPLYSDTLISAPALRVTRRLVRVGFAEEVDENGNVRLRSTDHIDL